MNALFTVGFAVGFAGGALLGYLVTVRLVERVATLGRATIVRACALGAGVLALVPASFPAFVLGGNFGGAWAAFLLGEWAVAAGIGLGIALALAICLCGVAVVGAIVGVVVSRALGKQRAA
jgi:hypothetical protein